MFNLNLENTVRRSLNMHVVCLKIYKNRVQCDPEELPAMLFKVDCVSLILI